MANPWSTPHRQQNHIPSFSDAPSQANQWQTATRPDAYGATRGCSCSWCSVNSHNELPVWGTGEYQNPWLPDDPVVPFVNQTLGADNPAVMVNAQSQAPSVVPQVYGTAGYAPLRDEERFSQAQTDAGLDRTPALDTSVMDSLRRIARRLVNNPESIVNVVRLEPAASGRFQVVIILEIGDVL